jgi:hypothetical protein
MQREIELMFVGDRSRFVNTLSAKIRIRCHLSYFHQGLISVEMAPTAVGAGWEIRRQQQPGAMSCRVQRPCVWLCDLRRHDPAPAPNSIFPAAL